MERFIYPAKKAIDEVIQATDLIFSMFSPIGKRK